MRKICLILLIFFCAIAGFGNPFKWSFHPDKDGATAELEISPGYYVYYDSIVFAGGSGSVKSPKPEKNSDDIDILSSGKWFWRFAGDPENLSVVYQGCSLPQADGAAICLLPEKVQLRGGEKISSVDVPEVLTAYPEILNAKLIRSTSGYMDESEFLDFLQGNDPALANSPSSGMEKSFLYMLILALVGGIVLNLTPCVLPLIPINIAIINSGAAADRKRGFFNGLLYGAGMALAYGFFGFGVLRFGIKFGDLNGNIYFQLGAALIFLFLGIASMGVVDFDLSKFFREKKSTLRLWKSTGIFLLGALAALLAGACVAPVTVALLVFAAAQYSSGNFGALFLPLALGIGMGLPWPFFGAGIAILPKPGKFMLYIKYLFAVILIGGAVWFGFNAFNIYRNSDHTPQKELARLERAAIEAKKKNQLLLVDCQASWCTSCREMEKDVLPRGAVQKELENFVFVRFRTENLHDQGIRFLLDRWRISGLPGFAVLKCAE